MDGNISYKKKKFEYLFTGMVDNSTYATRKKKIQGAGDGGREYRT